jgi:U3 small nucleolar RNA-associated protein 5
LSNVAVTSGVELGIEHEEPMTKGIDGDLDVDLAELSLGQRLATLSGTEVLMDENVASDPESDTKLPARELRTRRSKEKDPDRLPTGAQSLARTLIQALHSSDTRLLESCLLHTDQKVVMNTVRRLPSQLTVPLLNACVERLGRGVRAGTGKGGGGGASAQRGSGLVKWVRAVLVVHTAYLMTVTAHFHNSKKKGKKGCLLFFYSAARSGDTISRAPCYHCCSLGAPRPVISIERTVRHGFVSS